MFSRVWSRHRHQRGVGVAPAALLVLSFAAVAYGQLWFPDAYRRNTSRCWVEPGAAAPDRAATANNLLWEGTAGSGSITFDPALHDDNHYVEGTTYTVSIVDYGYACFGGMLGATAGSWRPRPDRFTSCETPSTGCNPDGTGSGLMGVRTAEWVAPRGGDEAGQAGDITIGATISADAADLYTVEMTLRPIRLTAAPSPAPTAPPTAAPTAAPTLNPTFSPLGAGSTRPTRAPSTTSPTTAVPTEPPTLAPTLMPTVARSPDGIRIYGGPRQLTLPNAMSSSLPSQKWKGGVFSPSTGLVYGVPHRGGVRVGTAGLVEETILAVNPATDAIDLIRTGGTYNIGMPPPVPVPQWSAGVLDPGSGKIFFVPNGAAHGGVFDPATNVTDRAAFESSRQARRLRGPIKWNDGVYHAGSGKIWCIPVMPNPVQAVMSVDPATNVTVDHEIYLDQRAPEGPYGGWPGAVSDEVSGKIFAVPAHANHGVLVIDPSQSTTSSGVLYQDTGLTLISVPAAPFQAESELGWAAAVQDPVSRKIIGLPRLGVTGLLVIDPNDESVEIVRLSGAVREYMAAPAMTTGTVRRPQWTGAAYHPWTRNIVAVSSNAPVPTVEVGNRRQDLLVIDPATMATRLQRYTPPARDASGSRVPAVIDGWQTAVFEPVTGKIVGIPYNAPSVLVVGLPDGIAIPTATPTAAPATSSPTSAAPTRAQTLAPTVLPTAAPTAAPTPRPNFTPTISLADQARYNSAGDADADDANDGSLLFGLSLTILIAAAAGLFAVAALVCCCARQRQKRWNTRSDHFGGWGGVGSGGDGSMVNPAFAGFERGERAMVPGHSGPDPVPEMEKPSYVPLSTVMNLTREESEKQLKGFSTGSFVVRPSPRSPTGKSISLIYDHYGVATIANFTLERDQGGYFVGGNTNDKFSTFEQLLTTACIQTIPPFPCALNPLPDDTVLRLSKDRKGGSPAPALRGEEDRPRRTSGGSSTGAPPSASRTPKGTNTPVRQSLRSVEEAVPAGPSSSAAPPQQPTLQLDNDDYVAADQQIANAPASESKPVLNIDMNSAPAAPEPERQVLTIDMNNANPNLAAGDPGWVHPGDEEGTELEI